MKRLRDWFASCTCAIYYDIAVVECVECRVYASAGLGPCSARQSVGARPSGRGHRTCVLLCRLTPCAEANHLAQTEGHEPLYDHNIGRLNTVLLQCKLHGGEMLADIVRQFAKQGRTIQLTPQLVRPLLPPLPHSLFELYIHHSSRYHFNFSAHQNDNARSATSPSGLEQATQDAAVTAAATWLCTGDDGDQPEARYNVTPNLVCCNSIMNLAR